ncbi:protein LTO1 homolog [Amphiura filiformis]|uniref:protein LTO1 homolog n=1 Tax=Amphiura filiformis TaxID=82378 RepID=UPI003B210CCA
METQKEAKCKDKKCTECQCNTNNDCGIRHPNVSEKCCDAEKIGNPSSTSRIQITEQTRGDEISLGESKEAANTGVGDDDDFLDAIVMAEEEFQDFGFKKGFILGERSGFEQGRQTGHIKGREVGAEIGFYSGFATMWKSLLEKQQDKPRPRVKKALELLNVMIQEFPLDSPSHEGFWEDLKKIRAKFKQVASLLNVTIDASDGNTKPAMSF